MTITPTRRPAPARCAHCTRVRQVLAGALVVTALCLGLRAASQPAPAGSAAAAPAPVPTPMPAQKPMPGPVPASPTPTPTPTPTATATPTPPSTAASAADLRLVYMTVSLPSGRRGVAYGPHQVARGGTPPYRFTVDGALPPGLLLSPDGRLTGTPTATGSWRFVLDVQDAAALTVADRQAYVLRVNAPAPRPASPAAAARPASAAAAVPPPPREMRSLTIADADATANMHTGQPTSYQLTLADVAPLLPKAEPRATAQPVPPAEADPLPLAATAEPAMAAPMADQLKAILDPLIDVQYPTLPLFVNALEQARCAYYLTHVREMAHKEQRTVDPRCPPVPPAPRKGGGVEPGISLRAFYDALLPQDMREELIRLAEKRHPFNQARPLSVQGRPCGCSPQRRDDEVIGLMPYWLATEAPLPVNFGLYTRLGYMGVVLGDDGGWLRPPGWDGRAGDFAREARRHGTQLDLVLYRRDWSALMGQSPEAVDELARIAARNAVQVADTRHVDLAARLDGLQLPGWRESQYLYDGFTVFFADAPTEGRAGVLYARFLKLFLQRLVAEMQATGRAYQTNIVVPDQQLADTGAYNYEDLMDLVESAERRRSSKGVDESDKLRYSGTTDLTISFLVLMDAPLGQATEGLRRRVEQSPKLQGHRRVAFLESVMPVVFHPRGADARPLAPLASEALDRDLGYIKWSYGGVALWPAPSEGLGAGTALQDLVQRHYVAEQDRPSTLCAYACPNRLPLRLLYQALMLCVLVGTALYIGNCRVRRLGTPYLLALWAGAALTALVAVLVFNCDPALAYAREQSYGLMALIGLLLLGVAYVMFKPKVVAP